jgi:tetratricopeptide (TPR) repeat protein
MLGALPSFLLIAASGTVAVQPQQPSPPPQTNGPQTIVVVGARLTDLRAQLADCLARHCRPDEDIEVTTALANALFVANEYREARSVLLASIGRNRGEAAHYPEPVSELYRANALVARHLGFDQDAQRSTWEILHALQRGIPVEDNRHFTARLEVIESLTAFGEYRQARDQLRELASRARTAGRDDVVTIAEMRGFWLAYIQAPDGNEIVRDLIALSNSADARRALAARRLLIRIYSGRGQLREANALIAGLGVTGTRRLLLVAPFFDVAQQDNIVPTTNRTVNGTTSMPPPRAGQDSPSQLLAANLADRLTDVYDQTIDVGFRIRPDGTVTEVEVLNRRGAPGWEVPLMRSISGRRYAIASEGTETYRVERYTYTAERRTQGLSGTHIGNRSPRGRVEFRELSETNIPAGPRTGSP